MNCRNCGCKLPRKMTGKCTGCRGINKLVRVILRDDLTQDTGHAYERRRAGEREARMLVSVPRT